jgi:hypothetical protein
VMVRLLLVGDQSAGKKKHLIKIYLKWLTAWDFTITSNKETWKKHKQESNSHKFKDHAQTFWLYMLGECQGLTRRACQGDMINVDTEERF